MLDQSKALRKAPVRLPKGSSDNRTFIEISDLMTYMFCHTSASGIQRVVIELIRVHIDNGLNAEFVIADGREDSFIVADKALIAKLIDGIDGGLFSRDSLSALLQEMHDTSREMSIDPTDSFFVCGAIWASATAARSIYIARRNALKITLMIYDLIPILHPDYCDESLTRIFQSNIDLAIEMCDAVLCISEDVAVSIRDYIATKKLKLKVTSVALADQMMAVQQDTGLRAEVSQVLKRPFVLVVSTIEVRKNHIFTFLVWQKLIENKVENVPDLVWVGRRGWLIDDMMARIERLDHLDGRLKILSGLSDTELALLYRHCWLTMLPSLSEGWGLPVSESLMFGKPAIISDISVFKEVSRGFAWHLDPHDVTGAVKFMTELLATPWRVDEAAAKIKKEFKPRSWQQVGADAVKEIAALAGRSRKVKALPEFRLVAGECYTTGLGQITGERTFTTADVIKTEGILDYGWYNPESWGRWVRDGKGSLRVTLPESEAPTPYLLHVRINSFEGWKGTNVSVFCAETQEGVVVSLRGGTDVPAFIEMQLPGGPVTLTFWAEGMNQVSAADIRKLSIGLMEFGLAPLSDKAAVARLRALGRPAQGADLKAQPMRGDGAPPATPLLQKPFEHRNMLLRIFRESPVVTLARVFKRLAIWLEKK